MNEPTQVVEKDQQYFIKTPTDELEITLDELALFSGSVIGYNPGTGHQNIDPTWPARRVASLLTTQITEELEGFSEQPPDFMAGVHLRREIQQSRNPVMIDSTTFYNAERAISEDWGLDTLRMFDLNVLINAAILFDDVYVTSGANVSDMNEALGEPIFKPIPQANRDVANFHYFIWTSIERMLRNLSESEIQTLKKSWTTLLDIDIERIEFNWDEADTYVNTPYNFFSDQGYYLDPLDGSTTDDQERLTEILSISTYRTYYNHELARRLGLIYLSNSVRGPIHHHLLSENRQVQENWDMAINAFAQRHSEDVQRFNRLLGQTISYELPMFFSMVVNRADNPDELLSTIKQIRTEAARYRARSQELIQELSEGVTEKERLLRMLEDSKSDFTSDNIPTIDVAIPIQPDVPLLPGGALELSVALKLLAGVLPFVETHGTELYRRLRYPRYYFLLNVREEAREFTAAQPAIEKLWGNRQRIDYDFLRRLEENYPYFE